VNAVNSAPASRLPFFLAIALIAAALTDPFVESVSNTGLLGRGYSDNDHLGVLPTLLVGTVLALGIAAMRCVEVWRRETATERHWLGDAAKDFSARSPIRDLPLIFGLQLCALFLLESSEQLLDGGHLLGGTVWLGGPIAFSLATHGLVGAACTYALGAFMRAFVRIFRVFVRTALHFIWLSATRKCKGIGLRRTERLHHVRPPRVHQVGGRAPPRLLRTA
jgi:hypothetical protein